MDTETVAGVAGQPQPNVANGCDSIAAEKGPSETAGNPSECRTSDTLNTNYNADPTCFLPPNPEAVYQADCALRRTEDEAHRMKLAVLMSCQKNGVRAGFLERQIGIVKSHKVRVAAKTEVAL